MPPTQDELVAALVASVRQESAGHGEACYYCGEPCDATATDKGLWPVPFARGGVDTWQHASCVWGQLVENCEQMSMTDDTVINGQTIVAGQYAYRRLGPAIG